MAKQSTSIYDLQTMLRWLETTDNLACDGIFGDETEAAVRAFQREHRLPITGTVDQETWDAVRRAYAEAQVRRNPAEPLQLALQPNQNIAKGSDNLHLPLIQAMLFTLGQFFPEMPRLRITGILDPATSEAIIWLQALSRLPQTGEVDRHTWRQLANQYRLTLGDGSGTFPVRIAPKGTDTQRISTTRVQTEQTQP